MNIFAMTEIRRLAAILAPMSRDLRVPAPSSATAVSTRNGQRVHTELIQLPPYVDAHLNSVFWRLWLLLFPTGIALALALFYVVLPTATCRPNDAGCFALAWALWIVGCYALAGVAVALRIIRNTLRHRLFARQDFSSDGAQFAMTLLPSSSRPILGIAHGPPKRRRRSALISRAPRPCAGR